jgi:hypothetical protein
MPPGFFARLQRFRSRRSFRGLWLFLSLLVLGVQTALPAHQETHPLGEPDIACHCCVLGGHLSGMPGVAPPLPPVAACMESPLPLETGVSVVPFPLTRFSRGPPSTLHA